MRTPGFGCLTFESYGLRDSDNREGTGVQAATSKHVSEEGLQNPDALWFPNKSKSARKTFFESSNIQLTDIHICVVPSRTVTRSRGKIPSTSSPFGGSTFPSFVGTENPVSSLEPQTCHLTFPR